jgi:putative transposase
MIMRTSARTAASTVLADDMTASARGTVGRSGKNVEQKAGLNRAILDTAPGSFVNVLCVRAEEAGCQVVLLETRR